MWDKYSLFTDGPYMLSSCVCLSVCMSDTTHASIVSKRLNLISRKQRITIQSRDPSFLVLKISAIFRRRHPIRRRQMQVCQVKISDFRQITHYNWKTARYRRIVSSKVEQEVVCALLKGYVCDNIESLTNHSNHPHRETHADDSICRDSIESHSKN